MWLGGWALFPITSLQGHHGPILLLLPPTLSQLLLGGKLWLEGWLEGGLGVWLGALLWGCRLGVRALACSGLLAHLGLGCWLLGCFMGAGVSL